jgi:hypothetical protein
MAEIDVLRNIDAKLGQLLKWTRFAASQQIKNIIIHNLTNESQMLIYEYSDGTRGTREIAELAGIKSNQTVANYWKKWSSLGIVEPSPKHQGRYQRVCSLEEVGLPIPPLTNANEEENTDEQ